MRRKIVMMAILGVGLLCGITEAAQETMADTAVESGENAKMDSTDFTSCGYAVKLNGNLYYMRFQKDNFMSFIYQFRPDSASSYDMVMRAPDGTETVIDRISGKNMLGICEDDILYSKSEGGGERVQGINTLNGEKYVLEEGTILGASGQAVAYQGEDRFLYGMGTLGSSDALGYENYVGIDGDYVYAQMNDFNAYESSGDGMMWVYRKNMAEREEELVAVLPEICSENMGTTVLSQFMADGDDTYYSMVRLVGTQGLFEDGRIIRVRQEDGNPEILAENTSSVFQIMKKDGRTYLLYNSYEGGLDTANVMDTETGEIVGTVQQRLSEPLKTEWTQDGIYAYWDMSGTQYQVFTSEELAQLGFAVNDGSNSISSDVSVQDDGVYVYLCQGISENTGTALRGFRVERGMLARKNMETGEITVIYEME